MFVEDGCEVRVALEKPPGVYTIVFQGDRYPLAEVSPDADINSDGLNLVGELVQYMAEPASNRAVLAITQKIDGEPTLVPIQYDAETLSEELVNCFDTNEYATNNSQASNSPNASVPGPAQLRQQAEALGIDVANFYACPCGDGFFAVQMQSPPWKIASLSLHAGLNSCALMTNEKSGVEVIHAGGSAAAKQINCWAKVGLTTQNAQVNMKPAKYPGYDTESLQACYNIIGAKARQWLQAGNEINFLHDPDNDASTAEISAGTLNNLHCTAAR